MSDALIAELIAAIKAAIADGKGELHPHHLRRRLWVARIVLGRAASLGRLTANRPDTSRLRWQLPHASGLNTASPSTHVPHLGLIEINCHLNGRRRVQLRARIGHAEADH